ncbi:MAG: zinc-dependent alcohol dehydrogenase family protein [Chloroflexi bacterium]|nr:zinc-dependent alcohol dehydrogenase family protein [Chloroflexota bacterium]
MRAALLELPRPAAKSPLRLTDLPDPHCGAGDLLLDVRACGVCRTDLQLAEGDITAHGLPRIPGHQAVGRVLAVGAGVDGWKPGDRAGVAWLAETCGACRFCASGRENLCEQARFTGWDRDGGYATRMTAGARFAFRLPAGMDDMAAAPLLCGGVIGYRALKVSGIQPGGRLGLYGFGASALLALQVALHWGCEVFVCTRSGREQAVAREMGAAWAGDYDTRPPVLLDAAITFAPAGSVVLAALRALDRGGTVAINAIHLDHVPEFDYGDLWWERTIRSVANFTRDDAREFLALAAEIPIQTRIEAHPLAHANVALARLAAGQVSGAAVLTMD